jgi:chemotaxis protein MotB
MAEPPIIIKKVIKKGGHGHHGGAWKLAYADFVTAMMAFFLLMWLLGTTDEKTKKGISEYFQDPYKATKVEKGLIPSLDEKDPTEIDKQAKKLDKLDEKGEKEDKAQLENLRIKIEKMIKMNDKLDEMKDQIQMTITPEGLRIQIVDDKKMPMFKSGSAATEPHVRTILQSLAPVINQLPNKITINGHTDSKPFPDISKQYTNWELSSDRANSARYELNKGGFDEKKILRVAGLSDSIPYNAKDALDPINRRISIIVMNKKSEKLLLEEAGNKAGVKDSPAPAETKTGPAEHAASTGETAKPDAALAPDPHAGGAEKATDHEPEKPAAEPPKPEAGAEAKPASEPAPDKATGAEDAQPPAENTEAAPEHH